MASRTPKISETSRKNAAKKRKSGVRPPDLEWETRFGYPRVTVLGIDEVGRGCLAGPVVAAALLLPPVVDFDLHPWLKEVTDSKCLTAEKREQLAPLIEKWALSSAVGMASVEEIDRINIFHASHLAMVRAAEIAILRARDHMELGPEALHAIVDGKFLPKNLPCSASAVIKGDLRCLSVAAASILAKVWRDQRMTELDSQYPGYGFAVHKGYSTPTHAAALRVQGASPIHRRSFAPVAERIRRDQGDDGSQLELC
jgi:ribonuclease HII